MGFRLLLGGDAADLVLQLADALAELLLLSLARAPAQREQAPLGGHKGGDLGVACARKSGVNTISAAPSRSHSSRAFRAVISFSDLETIARLARVSVVVEPDDDVSRLDHTAVAYPQFPDNAASLVLHLLDVRVDHHHAGSDESAGTLSSRPSRRCHH